MRIKFALTSLLLLGSLIAVGAFIGNKVAPKPVSPHPNLTTDSTAVPQEPAASVTIDQSDPGSGVKITSQPQSIAPVSQPTPTATPAPEPETTPVSEPQPVTQPSVTPEPQYRATLEICNPGASC